MIMAAILPITLGMGVVVLATFVMVVLVTTVLMVMGMGIVGGLLFVSMGRVVVAMFFTVRVIMPMIMVAIAMVMIVIVGVPFVGPFFSVLVFPQGNGADNDQEEKRQAAKENPEVEFWMKNE